MIDLNNLPPRLNRNEASEYRQLRHGIGRTSGTLAKLACVGGGPKYRKVGSKSVAYDVQELDRWAKKNYRGAVTEQLRTLNALQVYKRRKVLNDVWST